MSDQDKPNTQRIDAPRPEQAEDALRESEAWLRMVIENIPDFVLVVDRNATIRFTNRPSPRAPEVNLIGTKGFEHVVPEHWPRCEEALRRALDTREVQTVESRTRHGGWWASRIVPLPDQQPEPIAMIVCTDISQRHRAEKSLQESEQKYREMTEKVNDIPYSMNAEGIFTYVGPQVTRYGFDPVETVGRCFLEFVVPEERERLTQELEKAVSTGEGFPSELRIRTRDGEVRWFEDEGRVQTDDTGNVIGITGILRDITERKQVEEAIGIEQQNLRRLLEMHERDKRLVAYEIHDGFVQPLTAAKMIVESLRPEFLEPSGKTNSNQYNRVLEMLSRSIDGARRLMSGQRPMILDEKGLTAAIEYLTCECAENGGPEIECSQDVQFDRLASPLETAVFRIVQESLNNALRHAQSTKVRIALERVYC